MSRNAWFWGALLPLLGAAAIHCGSNAAPVGFNPQEAGTPDVYEPPPMDDAGPMADAPSDRGSIFSTDGPAPPHMDSGVHPMCIDGGMDGGCSVGCGNGVIESWLGEQCDDGNTTPGDGCSATCQLEPNYVCPDPGKACIYTVKCGDGRIGGNETCDDGNTTSGDGCSSTCQIETGWVCPAPNQPCIIDCGDGILTGPEQCDPPNPGNGCSATCMFEPGWFCTPPPPRSVDAGPPPPATCKKTVCGNGVKEGNEACDDGNLIDGDGCSAQCTLEPDCSSGTCVSKCGDGILLPPEQCDDGNTTNGDGCSSTCQVESGWYCMPETATPPPQLNLAVRFRDFISFPINGAVRHVDFESNTYGAADTHTPGLAQTKLDTDGKPVLTGKCSNSDPTDWTNATICPWQQQMSVQTNFAQWYRDTAGVNIPLASALLMPKQANGSYVFDSALTGINGGGMYPLDNKGWIAAGKETTALGDDMMQHDFGFTTEIRYFFQYNGGEVLDFTGDDDVWVYINRTLALDLGGLHQKEAATLTVDSLATTLGITRGGLYEIALFHAERHTTSSNFKLTLTGFGPTHSVCNTKCGDGVVAGTEQCDPGMSDAGAAGAYNGCTADCKRGPYCGDGVVQNPPEKCDDGMNVTIWTPSKNTTACGPGCMPPDYCGDGKLDSLFGEQCDNGAANSDTAYDGCTTMCLLGPRCGDCIVQAGETCDDCNTVSGDGCDNKCQKEGAQ